MSEKCQKLERGLRAIPRNPLTIWSGRPDSNRRRPAWEAGILPLNYGRALSTWGPRYGPQTPYVRSASAEPWRSATRFYLIAMSYALISSSLRAFQFRRLDAP